jgi:hypothetical protein
LVDDVVKLCHQLRDCHMSFVHAILVRDNEQVGTGLVADTQLGWDVIVEKFPIRRILRKS